MTAKEMFEKLGFKEINDLIFRFDNGKQWYEIRFWVQGKYWAFNTNCSTIIDFQLTKAINQQIKELGWYEE